MRSVKINQDDLGKIRDLYESVMAHACHGLFFKEGGILGKEIATAALQDKDRYFEKAAELLKDRGWIESVEFSEGEVKVKGSFEATGRDGPTCHRLRGIIRELYERKSSTRVNCQEEECASTGKEYCRFLIKAA